ncbi:bardet-Biedl syndrome 5 protein [Nesidiocoris tenuis]|uniref:Bardet-Biedl syndrome 5 protein n=1 Tax=Nesidiocoris tenuis TaxID=355587 RepID=A0ABN7AMP1_9HEMI|nr:bardet-Biedl syndrome 5 protein [Nesidiocoris tenuis]
MAAIILGSGKSKAKKDPNELWEDREVRFDIPITQNRMRAGEKIIDKLDFVEDTKGNNGDKGRLIVTNLRIIWHSLSIIRISLSIGFSCIISASTKIVNSKLKGTSEALHLLTKSNNSRFEFIFTNLVSGNTRHFTSVMGVHKAYLSSRPYRELKLRGAVVRNKQLAILPLEVISDIIDGVWNLSSDQGNLGSFIITNLRLVWFAEMNENFNISLPYLQVSSVKIRESRFGPALVVESKPGSGGYVLGFRIDPPNKLSTVTKEIVSMCEIFAANPEYGVEYSTTELPALSESEPIKMEEVDEIETEDHAGVLSAYYAEGSRDNENRLPVYNSELGLAIEPLRGGHTLNTLWQIVPNQNANVKI